MPVIIAALWGSSRQLGTGPVAVVSTMTATTLAPIVVITLMFLTHLLYHLPKATLATVVIMAVFGLINFVSVKHIWDTNKHDGIAAIVTFIVTIGAAPKLDHGIILGAMLAIILYLNRTMRPRVAFLVATKMARYVISTSIKAYQRMKTS
ncbi:MAG: hypothetical protein BMS9Abin19_0345 [Gammaproteobacteria bacterium]|nr:MAG: hypothetical protein BMS9Abin19_0345 [Gammaproteobacteria bacterium]